MSGRYLYCQNTSCGNYLGCSGGDSCSICGWCAGRDMNDDYNDEQDGEERCSECGIYQCECGIRKHGEPAYPYQQGEKP